MRHRPPGRRLPFPREERRGTQLAEKLSNEPEAVITGLPVGANVTVSGGGRNTAGSESAASEPVAAVVP